MLFLLKKDTLSMKNSMLLYCISLLYYNTIYYIIIIYYNYIINILYNNYQYLYRSYQYRSHLSFNSIDCNNACVH